MPTTPDSFPGIRKETGVDFSDEAVDASAEGEVRYSGGKFSFYDSTGEFDPNSVGFSGHQTVDSLVHLIAEDGYFEPTYTGNDLTAATVFTDSGKSTKIREVTVEYTSGNPTTVTLIQYDGAGVWCQKTIYTLTWSGDDFQNLSMDFQEQ
jgi:hypothetical protein